MATNIDIAKVKQMVEIRQISLGKLSEMTGISKPMLSMMFNGKRNMSISKLNQILEACNISIRDVTIKK